MENNKNLKKSKIYKIIYIFLLILLIYNSVLIIQSLAFPNKTPNVLGIKTYIIASGSMKPKLNIGDIAIVKNTNTNDLAEGDIISYREGHIVVTHRIDSVIKTNNDIKFQTKGDNNNTADKNLVNKIDIEGKMIGKIPYLGYVLLALQNKYVIIGIILIYYIIVAIELKKS